MPASSRIVVGAPGHLGQTNSVFAYGDRDDPARLVVLLADRVLAAVDPTSEAAKAARTCLTPSTAWRNRLDSLRSALHDAANATSERFVVFWDADALATFEAEPWEQERSSLMRRDVLHLVREAAKDGGWTLVRTTRALSSGVSYDDLDLEREMISADAGVPEEARLFAPECWRVASWLVQRDILRSKDLVEINRTVPGADEHLVDLAYEALPAVARDAACLLTALRAPQPLNGCYGRLLFKADTCRATAESLPASTRELLVMSGLLQPTWADGPWRMPRIVRKRLDYFAQVLVEPELEKVHRSEAEPPPIPTPALVVEAHFHAVCTGDVELAKRTALYYGSELSEVAKGLSIAAQDTDDDAEKFHLFNAAADLFLHIVTNFDETDAYAWEYYGYNLARARAIDTNKIDPLKILKAYLRAYTLRRGNPLYHGRLLGFRGQLGKDVVEEAINSLRQYAVDPPDREPVSFFAEPLMDGLWRGGQERQARAILTACGPLLESLAPRAWVKAGWAR